MLISFLSKDLFSKRVFNTIYLLKNEDKSKTSALLNINNLKYTFINKKFERKISKSQIYSQI